MIKNLGKQRKKTKGITLIALVITIIILLIVISITIITLTGNNGILSKADATSEENRKQTATEIMNLKITNAQIQSYAQTQEMPTLQYLADMFYEDNEIQYVYNESQKVATKEPIIVSGEYIYTKLAEYPYEFKIDGNLRLAGIDGIEIADNPINKEDFVSKEEYNKLKEDFVSKEEYKKLQEDYNSLQVSINSLTSEITTLKSRPIPTTPMIDTSRVIRTLGVNETYTMAEDGIFVGHINAKPGGWWDLYVDGKCISSIGENGAGNVALTFPSVFLKKGSTISVQSSASYSYATVLNIWKIK